MDLLDQVKSYIADAKLKAADGLTMAEVGQIVYGFILLAVQAARALGNTGPEKKAIVLGWITELYDALAPFIPLPWYLMFFKPYLRSLFLQLVSGAIEAAYDWLTKQPS